MAGGCDRPGGVEQNRGAMAALLAREHAPDRSGVLLRIAAAQLLRIAARDPELERIELVLAHGGDAVQNAAAIRRVFAGEEGGHRSAVLLNAAGAIAASGHARDLAEGLALAREAVDSGAAGARLEELTAFTQAEVAV